MTDIKKLVTGMLGQNFGSYSESVKDFDKKYKCDKHNYINPESDCKETLRYYYGSKGNNCAIAHVYACDDGPVYSVWKETNELLGRKYYSEQNKDKFDYVRVENHVIYDANQNGKIDKNDKIWNVDKERGSEYIKHEKYDYGVELDKVPTIDEFLDGK